MARRATELDRLARRIEEMRAADRMLLLARMLVRSGARLDWSVLRRIRRRLKTRDGRALERAADEAVRRVRRDRARAC